MKITRKTALAHKSNYGGARPLSAIKYIIIHYTANDGDTDEGNGSYFQGANRNASAHYFVDDDSITNSVPDNYVAWSVGGSKWADCAQTGGGSLYGFATNANSISIEMCDTVKDGKIAATEKTMENTAVLCRELMKKYNVGIEQVIRHFDVNGKHCPAYFMDDSVWQGFKIRVLGYNFQVNKSCKTSKACYLRKSPGTGNNKAYYASLSDTLKKKCREKLGYAVFKKEKAFRLMEVKYIGENVWGRMKSGYWVPLVYKGEIRAKIK